MKLEINTVRIPLAAMALALVAAIVLPALSAQQPPQQPPPGAGVKSQPGQAQRGQPLPGDASGPRMPAGEPGKARIVVPADTPIGGKVLKMEAVLQTPIRPVPGEQPSREEARAIKPSGGGGQRDPKALEALSGSHLQLVLRVTEGGEAEVVSAAEVPGPAPLTTEPLGDYAYEVTEGETTVAVQALPDPFEMRSFSPPGKELGHHIERAKAATVAVDLPLPKDDAAVNRLGVNLIKLEPGRTLEKVDVAELARLKQEKRVRVISTLPAARMAPQLRDKTVPLNKVIAPPQ
ncbi:MAG: hypothetical protein ACJ75H_21970 [Thermoanaerobaculia bacterium]